MPRAAAISASVYLSGRGSATIVLNKLIAERIQTSRVKVYVAKGIIILCPTEEQIGFPVSRKGSQIVLHSREIAEAANLQNRMKTVDVQFLENGCIELIFPNYEGEEAKLLPYSKEAVAFIKSGERFLLYIPASIARKLKTRKFLVYAAKGIVVLCPCSKNEELLCFSGTTANGIIITANRIAKEVEAYPGMKSVEIRSVEDCLEIIFPNYEGESPKLIPAQKLVTLQKTKLKATNSILYRVYLSEAAYKKLGLPKYVKVYANKGIIVIEPARYPPCKKVVLGNRQAMITLTKAIKMAEAENLEPEYVEVGPGRIVLIFPNYEETKDVYEV